MIESESSAKIFCPIRLPHRAAVVAILFCLIGIVGPTQAQQAVCDNGDGRFEAQFSTGVSVRVDANHSAGFAKRMCEATLSWNQEQLVAVPHAPQVDIDVLGPDLGLGEPVVAFQVRKVEDDWQSTYLIYTLRRNPRLLTKITGGDSYRAVDADFNKRVAIWTTDAAAVNGFDGLTYGDYDSPPTIVLNFERGKLTDVSAHYQPQYDRQIAALRAQLNAQELTSFRKSDGRLAFGSVPPDDWTKLRKTKVKVLEIVWAYLYSGRPLQAWAELDKAWPPADAARVKAAILAARTRGIVSQAASVASAKLPSKWHDAPVVFSLKAPASASGMQSTLNQGWMGKRTAMGVDTAPVAISLWRPPLSASEQAPMQAEEIVQLVIDEAGKVWSAKMVSPSEDLELVTSAKYWKFIPAFKDGRPVAYDLKIAVHPYQ